MTFISFISVDRFSVPGVQNNTILAFHITRNEKNYLVFAAMESLMILKNIVDSDNLTETRIAALWAFHRYVILKTN